MLYIVSSKRVALRFGLMVHLMILEPPRHLQNKVCVCLCLHFYNFPVFHVHTIIKIKNVGSDQLTLAPETESKLDLRLNKLKSVWNVFVLWSLQIQQILLPIFWLSPASDKSSDIILSWQEGKTHLSSESLTLTCLRRHHGATPAFKRRFDLMMSCSWANIRGCCWGCHSWKPSLSFNFCNKV